MNLGEYLRSTAGFFVPAEWVCPSNCDCKEPKDDPIMCFGMNEGYCELQVRKDGI